MEQILERAKTITLSPRLAWEQIQAEEISVSDIFTSYLVYLAAVPAVCWFIGRSVVGYLGLREPVGRSLLAAVLFYAFSLVGIWVVAKVVDWLAPNFAGTKNELNAMKLVGYSATPVLAGGIFWLIPSLSVLYLLASLYSIYLIYTGLPVLMGCPKERAAAYTVATALTSIGVWVVALVILTVLGLAASSTWPW